MEDCVKDSGTQWLNTDKPPDSVVKRPQQFHNSAVREAPNYAAITGAGDSELS